MHHHAVHIEQEIRAIAPDRIIDSPARIIPFTPRLTGPERWDKLSRVDPRTTEMLRTIFETMYAFHFPDE